MLMQDERLMIHDVALEVEQEFDRSNLSEIAKHVHCDRKTVRKYLNSRNLPVVIKKRKRTSKQNPFKPYIISRLAEYPQLFGKRILRDIQERGYDGCYSIVTDYLREIRDE